MTDHSIQEIKKPEGIPTLEKPFLDKLRNTWFYRVYSRSLKQYPPVRWLFRWLWFNARPIYVNYVLPNIASSSKRYALRWRSLEKLSDYFKQRQREINILADEEIVKTPVPHIFPSCAQDYLRSPHDFYKSPKIWVANVIDGMIYGGSNLVLVDDVVLCHDLYDFSRDYTSEELHSLTLINSKHKRIRWLFHDANPDKIPAAATFVDACASNYAHWLTEILPRVAVFCAEEQFKDIPIVVNEGLHKNIVESLILVTGSEREIIYLPIGRALQCDSLYVTSATGYVPFGWRKKKLSDCSHGVFSPHAFTLMCKQITGQVKNIDNQSSPSKIFIRRNSDYRIVINSSEVENYFLSRGYVTVEPEKLTFLQQVALFKNAKTIVSSSGAALANLIFAPPESKILILISKHPDTIYWYWQNIACASGKTIEYFLGKIKEKRFAGIHSSFFISLDDLETLISKM